MPKRNLKSDDEAGFLRAYRDEVMDLALEHNCTIVCRLLIPLHGAGLEIEMHVLQDDAEGLTVTVARERYPYPSHSATRLHGALYRAAVRIGIVLRDQRRAEMLGDEQATG